MRTRAFSACWLSGCRENGREIEEKRSQREKKGLDLETRNVYVFK